MANTNTTEDRKRFRQVLIESIESRACQWQNKFVNDKHMYGYTISKHKYMQLARSFSKLDFIRGYPWKSLAAFSLSTKIYESFRC